MDEKNETLGRRIARLRLEYGMTQEDVAHFASNVLATQQRLLGNNYVPLSEGEIETIYAARL